MPKYVPAGMGINAQSCIWHHCRKAAGILCDHANFHASTFNESPKKGQIWKMTDFQQCGGQFFAQSQGTEGVNRQ